MGAFRLIQSFNDAGRGLSHAFKHEQNFRLQIVASLVVLAATFVFPLKIWEIILIILLCVMVLTMELLNTALENFADLLKPRLHHYVYIIKDVMAAAVLLTSLGALIIGLIIFLPHLINFWK
ncbi:MAG: diacylglycerol kinase [Patescibacteria group bacterium]